MTFIRILFLYVSAAFRAKEINKFWNIFIPIIISWMAWFFLMFLDNSIIQVSGPSYQLFYFYGTSRPPHNPVSQRGNLVTRRLFLLSCNWNKGRNVSVFVLVSILDVLYWSADYTGGGVLDAWPTRLADQWGKRGLLIPQSSTLNSDKPRQFGTVDYSLMSLYLAIFFSP